jgi:hypothetical protein
LLFLFCSCGMVFCMVNLRSCSKEHKFCRMCVEEITIEGYENGY